MTWKVSEIYEPQPSSDEKALSDEKEVTKLGIKEWAIEDRPREKLMAHGAEALSSAELLAILVGSGNKKESAVDLMKRLLKDCDNNLARLSKMSIDELMTYEGIGEAKAITILAACELARRREQTQMPERKILSDARKMYEHLWPRMRDLDVEESYVILMNSGFKEIKTVRLSHGGITETAVDVRLIMKEALLANATILAIAHNHPSGNVKPSRDDDNLTKMIADACRTMRILFADHLVISDGDYYSYQENGRL